MLEELQRRNLSQITAQLYLRAVEEFSLYYNVPPDQLGPEHIRQYQAHLFTDRKLDATSVSQQLSALRFFFVKTLKRPLLVGDMPFPKRPTRLPDILCREEVERLIGCAANLLHRIWMLILYATGMRRDELVHLKVSDIDCTRMLIHIRQGKGKKGSRRYAQPEITRRTSRLLAVGPAQAHQLPVSKQEPPSYWRAPDGIQKCVERGAASGPAGRP
jgi:site-specific recombinase XerD